MPQFLITILSFLQNDKVIDVAEPLCTTRVTNPMSFLGTKGGFLGYRTFSAKTGTVQANPDG